jgi:hypothetical protein
METMRDHRTRGAKLAYLVVAVVIVVSVSGVASAAPLYSADNCTYGTQDSGAKYLICMPPDGMWNQDLVVYAHGYVAFNEPVAIPEDQLSLPDGTSIPGLINALGFAFATTSYCDNGLVVQEAIEDLKDLVEIFQGIHGQPGHVYLVGASEGGLNTALAVEQDSGPFSGGLATCGPVGNFRQQINYYGDVRVLFDYFFPGVIPGSPVDIPEDVIINWESLYEPAVVAALSANPHATEQLLATARVPMNRQNPEANVASLVQLLWYNVFATNDAVAKLGGQPYGNRLRIYTGSDNDRRLNRLVQRFRADPAAIAAIEAGYQTSGDPQVPLVTLHTLKDPIVPYWHETLYNIKVLAHGNWRMHTNIPTLSYGHCNFTPRQVLLAFGTLVLKVTGSELQNVDSVLSSVE